LERPLENVEASVISIIDLCVFIWGRTSVEFYAVQTIDEIAFL
jgi:hypothetical protein